MRERDWLSSLASRARADRVLVLGLMSGTSADGVDAALVEASGRGRHLSVREIAFTSTPYGDDLRAWLFRAFAGDATVADVCRLNVEVGEAFAAAALRTLGEAGAPAADVVAIGSHGQTIWHMPPSATGPAAGTLQVGEPAVIAARTGIPVVSDFRAADMARGGEGAPLVPYVDWLLFTHPAVGRVAQNIGGVANLTFLPAGARREDVTAFDTGPGNAPIDAAVQALTAGREAFDRDGALGRSGRPNSGLIREWLEHPYFRREPPKSTGRETFGAQWASQALQQGRARALSPTDIVATLTHFTAHSIADACARFVQPRGPFDDVIVSGGGARNPVLMAALRDALAERGMRPRIVTPEPWGLSVESKEAVAFALFARETLLGIATNLPSVTGASAPAVLGSVTPSIP